MAGRHNATPSSPPSSTDGGRRSRSTASAVLAISAAAIAIGLAITFGGLGGAGDTASPSGSTSTEPRATSGYADLSLAPVVPTAIPAATGIPTPMGSTGFPISSTGASGSANPSPIASAGAARGIRATRIRIDRLGIDLKIVEGDGVDAPIGKAAHYPGSAWPGGGSNIYIYGHAQEGMFLNLWDARVGDAVVLDLVDGTTRTYRVDRVLPKVPWNAMQYVRPTAAEQLTLQTSTSYHPTSPRFIVIAVPAS